MYSDTQTVKLIHNDVYLVILARSPETGKFYILVYRDKNQYRSEFLHAAYDYSSITSERPEDVSLDITGDHRIMITSNKDKKFV